MFENKFVTILGPSGSGKTTVIKLIAGFETVDTGDIIIGGVKVNGLSPNKREVNTVFQNYSLFPHMSVYENIAFGLKMKNKSQSYIQTAVAEVLKIIKMEKFADRKPDQLSGGQQQRVAVARAIVNKPLILLLDEPLSALDEKLRKQMQVELKQMQQALGITFILVTHDQEEALSISDIVIVINGGNIEQIGSPQEIYEKPVNSFVAGFVGELNILDAKLQNADDNIATLYVENSYLYQMPLQQISNRNNELKLMIRPENLIITKVQDQENHELHDQQSKGMRGKITQLRYRGALLDYLITLNSGKKIIATAFQHESKGSSYQPETEVLVSWIQGKEVLT